MKNHILILLAFLCYVSLTSAQGNADDPLLEARLKTAFRVTEATVDNNRVELPAGTHIKIVRFRNTPLSNKPDLLVMANNRPYIATQEIVDAIDFDVNRYSLEDIWTIAYLRSESLKNYGRHGKDLKNRQDLLLEYNSLKEQLDVYRDDYLTDYLYDIAFQVFPGSFIPFFPATLGVHIFAGVEPTVFGTSDGELYISTGMLTALQSEDELVALITLELAHLYLDHPYLNYKSLLRTQRRAEFWASLATVGAAILETAAYTSAASSGNLSPYDAAFFGDFTMSTAFLSFGIASLIANRLGLEYTDDQKAEAQSLAEMVLDKLGYDRSTLLTLYARVDDFYNAQAAHFLAYETENRYDHAYTFEGARDIRLTDKYEMPDEDYMIKMQSVNLASAFHAYADRNYGYAEGIVQRELENGHPIIDYYLLNCMIQRRKPNNTEGMTSALKALEGVRERAAFLPIDYHRELALINIRLGHIQAAIDALEDYRSLIGDNPNIEIDAQDLRWIDQTIQILTRKVNKG